MRPALKADNLTVICEPIALKMRLDISQSYEPSRPITGINLRF
jgi:hypothetical protein